MRTIGQDLGLLFIRLMAGGLMLSAHGWGKLANFSVYAAQFPDPIGLGSTVALSMAIFAEVFCACLIVSGFVTRLAAAPLVITMFVAVFIVHGADPFSKKELALMYGTCFFTILLAGPGRFSLDYVVYYKKKIQGAVFRP